MQRRALVFAVLTTLLIISAASGFQEKPAAARGKSGLRCEIWSAKAETSQGSTLLRISIENDTSEDIVLKGIEARLNTKGRSSETVLRDSTSSYWSWIDPETKGPLKISFDPKGGITYPEKKLNLQAGKNLEFTIDLAKLQWTNELSSTLPPSGTLHAVVPDGAYEALLDFNGENKGGNFSFESNKTTIEIRKEAKTSR